MLSILMARFRLAAGAATRFLWRLSFGVLFAATACATTDQAGEIPLILEGGPLDQILSEERFRSIDRVELTAEIARNRNFAKRKPGGYSIRIEILLDETKERRQLAVLVDDLFFCYPETGDILRVPTGFVTDFASIPEFALFVIDSYGRHAEASVLHDWLYAVGRPDERLYADEVFRFAMREAGVGRLLSELMFKAVQAFGSEAYGREGERQFRDPNNVRQALDPSLFEATDIVFRDTDCAEFESRLPQLREEFPSYLKRISRNESTA